MSTGRRLRSPLWYIGGKGRMVAKLLRYIPPHKIYVEVFGGGASLLFAKEPSPVEVYNDIDSAVVNFFRVLRDPEKFEEFYKKVYMTPYSREEYNFCANTWQDCEDEIERAYRWFVMVRQDFAGRLGNSSWGFSVTTSARGMSMVTSAWLSTIEMLPEIHARIMRVQIENDNFRKIIPRYDTDKTFMYLDPPYVPETRKNKKDYDFEMSLEDHQELIDLILSSRSMFMLSGYRHPIHKKLEDAGWQRIDFQTACHAVGRTRNSKFHGGGSVLKHAPRTENIWLSPNTIAALNPLLFSVSQEGVWNEST